VPASPCNLPSKQRTDLRQPDLLVCISVFDVGVNFRDIV